MTSTLPALIVRPDGLGYDPDFACRHLCGADPALDALIAKVGGAFTSTASQHGGQETTLTSLHTFFYHMGMVITGVPYSAQELLNMSEITGGTPYGASTITGAKGERMPSANELAIARFQGKHATSIGAKLANK